MAAWVLIACLRQLFAEFDRIAPRRDHASDGSIGDTAHQHEVSDHNPDETGSVPIHDTDKINEVHAIDVDDTLTGGPSMETVVQFLLARCRSGAETRLRYIIYNRRIWEADNGWRQRAYTGASPHTEHAHFSASYTTGKEASTASWHLEDIPMALTPEDKTWISGQIEAVAEKVWAQKVGNPDYPNKTAKQVLNDLGVARDAVADPKIGAKNIAAGTPLALVIEAVTKPEA
jgi:hypothetical protein